ncbi:MAG: shikimate kinase [Gemmatimonadaceae bacterium]
MSIVLLGLPGVGKTTVGAEVARRLGWPFLDFDMEIERRTGMTVAGLFSRHGEAHFRALEAALTDKVAGRAGMVMAPGGGWAVQPGLMDRLRPSARLVYLRASPAVVAARMGASRVTRPLLRDAEPLATLERLLLARGPAYARADAIVDTELLDREQVIRTVTALAPAGVGGIG